NIPGTDQNRTNFPDTQRPIFLSGKVMLADGTAPTESVTIEKICNGNPRPVAYTSSKGRFSFQLGNTAGVMADASTSSLGNSPYDNSGGGGFGSQRQTGGSAYGNGERDLMNCELRASLPGFRSDTVSLAGHRLFDNPDVGTIILRRMGNVEGTTISATSLQAPKDARKAFEKGRELLKKEKNEDAGKEFQKAVDSYPKYAVAWYELGHIQAGRNDFEGARKSYEQAIAADSKYVNPYLEIASISARGSNWKETADVTSHVIHLNAVDFPIAYFYNAVANYNLKDLDAAEKSAREAQKLDTQHRLPKADQILGVILIEKKDFAGAAEQMRSYLKFAPAARDADQVRSQLSQLEKLAVARTETPQP
ncbi:MAG: tetratricopeptide repeat protein, partial [Acidobacteriota bacterium]|nr:tetratricopeptide repeat protein [Acidobacteriota bacterium]